MITVLPGFNVYSICKVYLELTSLGCFLNVNGVIYGQALTDCITVLLSIVFWRKLSHNLYA